MVQAQIESRGNQQWHDVNKLLKAIELTAWIDDKGNISIGDMVLTKVGKFTTQQRPITWAEPQEQTNTIQLGYSG